MDTTITKEDLAAMRAADLVSFHYARTEGQPQYMNSGTTTIQLSKRIEVKGFDTSDDVKRFIEGFASGCYDYKRDENRGPFTEGFEMIHSAQHSQEWRTIVKLLRTGDELRFQWDANAGSCPVLDEVGIVSDKLTMLVFRANKRAYTFVLSSRAGRDNSARMIRRGRYNNG